MTETNSLNYVFRSVIEECFLHLLFRETDGKKRMSTTIDLEKDPLRTSYEFKDAYDDYEDDDFDEESGDDFDDFEDEEDFDDDGDAEEDFDDFDDEGEFEEEEDDFDYEDDDLEYDDFDE